MKCHTYIIHVALAFLICASGIAQPADSIKIICFGNSTTAPRKNINKVYPDRLEAAFQKRNIPAQIINSGLGGSHSGSVKDNNFHKVAHAKDRFDTAVLKKNPDWVIIAFGINDAWQDKGPGSIPRIPLQQYLDNLTFFIEKIKLQHGRVILLSPNPIGLKYESWRLRQLCVYAKATKRLARKKKLAFVNTWKLFYKAAKQSNTNIDFLLLDGMHPNDKGHEIMSNAILKILFQKNNLPKIKK